MVWATGSPIPLIFISFVGHVTRRNPQYKKHKTWDGDAVLVVNAVKATLYDMEGKSYVVLKLSSYDLFSTPGCHRIAVGKAEWPLHEGRTFYVATKEIELERPLTKSEYLSGRCFDAPGVSTGSPSVPNNGGLSRQFVPLKINYPPILPSGISESKRSAPMRPADPLLAVGNSSLLKEHTGLENSASHWTANWYASMSSVFVLRWLTSYRRKKQTKTHKTWDGDAYVSHFGDKLVMVSEEGEL